MILLLQVGLTAVAVVAAGVSAWAAYRAVKSREWARTVEGADAWRREHTGRLERIGARLLELNEARIGYEEGTVSTARVRSCQMALNHAWKIALSSHLVERGPVLLKVLDASPDELTEEMLDDALEEVFQTIGTIEDVAQDSLMRFPWWARMLGFGRDT